MIISKNPILVTLAVLALGGTFTTAEQITEVSGFGFGEIRPRHETDAGRYIYHIEVDAADPERLLIAEKGTLTMLINNDTVETMIGSSESGFANGNRSISKFTHISGFVQMNASTVIVSDLNNHCMRVINRDTVSTQTFAGICQRSGHTNGALEEAQFSNPVTVIKDLRSNTTALLVADSGRDAIRHIDLVQQLVTTLLNKGLARPSGIAFTALGGRLVISNQNYLAIQDPGSENATRLSIRNSTDSTTPEVEFSYPHQALALSENVVILSDSSYLWLINLELGMATQLCLPKHFKNYGNNPYTTCALGYSIDSLIVHDGVIYAGGNTGVWMLSLSTPEHTGTKVVDPGDQDEDTIIQPCSAKPDDQFPWQCLSRNVSLTLAKGETSASVEVLPGVFSSFAIGNHSVSVPKQNCTITVIVTPSVMDNVGEGVNSLVLTILVSVGSLSVLAVITLYVIMLRMRRKLVLVKRKADSNSQNKAQDQPAEEIELTAGYSYTSLKIPNYESPDELHQYSTADNYNADYEGPDDVLYPESNKKKMFDQEGSDVRVTSTHSYRSDSTGVLHQRLNNPDDMNQSDKDYEGPDEVGSPINPNPKSHHNASAAGVIHSSLEFPGFSAEIDRAYEGPYGVVSLNSFRTNGMDNIIITGEMSQMG